MIPYIKLFNDLSATIDLLSDAEAGRLLKSLLHYANGQEVELVGQEKLVFAMLKTQIDRDAAGYNDYIDKQRTNGSKGGRPKKPMVNSNNPENPTVINKNPKNPMVFNNNPENPMVFNENPKNLDKEEEKEKEEDEEETPIIPINIPFASDEELIAIQEAQNEIFDHAEYVGLNKTRYTQDALARMLATYGKDAVIYALDEAGRLGKLSIGYIEAILKDPKKNQRQAEPDDDWALVEKTMDEIAAMQ